MSPDDLHTPLCLDCKHVLLYEHYAGDCTCGCPTYHCELPSESLAYIMKRLQHLYHYHRGNPLGSQAKKAYYTLWALLELRGSESLLLAQATQRQEASLSEV